MTNALVLGAGMMGSALAYDLARSGAAVTIADIDGERSRRAAAAIGDRVRAAILDINDHTGLLSLMRTAQVAIGATSYTHNLLLTRAAIEAGIHFCDLGGNMEVVGRQMALDAEAKRAGVAIIPNCGLAPGMACVVAAEAARRFSRVDDIRIRVGGLPQHPRPPLNYQLVFSAEGLINEYLEPAEAIRNGEVVTVPSMADLETLEFPAPFGMLEAFNTSGGVSTLPRMFAGKVRSMDYKTIRYQGHCERFRTLLELGFASSEPIMVGTSVRTARELFEELLRRKLPANGPDVVLTRVTVSGLLSGEEKTLAYEMIDYYDEGAKLTSMMRTTAFPTSVIAQMVTAGTIALRGVAPPEQCVPLDPFLRELHARRIVFTESIR